MSQSFNLLVFDWDGTLMDSEASIVTCMQGAINDLGCEPRSETEIKNIIGLGLREAIDTLYPGTDDAFLKAMVDRYRYHFLGGGGDQAELFPGAAETVRSLSEAGYLLAVATGKGRKGLDMVLEKTGLGHYFQATRCADETFSKPHPQMLEELMDVLGAEPGETLMIGDTEYDMQMANNAGAHALAVCYGVHERERLVQHNPLYCLDDISELSGWLAEEPVQSMRVTK